MSDSRQILLTLDDHPAPHTDALGWQWAYGCFETFCWRDGTTIGLDKHLDRLLLGCRELALECLLEKRDLEKRLKAALDPFGEKRLRVRLEAVLDDLGLMRGEDPPFRMRIGVRARETRFAGAQSSFSISLLTEEESAPFFPMPGYKPLAYGDRLRVRNRLLKQDLAEGIITTDDLQVVSGLTSNLFVRTSKEIWLTPNLGSGCLPGVTRALLLEGQTPEPVLEQEVYLHDLTDATAIVVTNSVLGVQPVDSLILEEGMVKKFETEPAQRMAMWYESLKD